MAGQLENVAEMFAALMWGPKTIDDLTEISGVSKTAVQRWIGALHDAGAIYIHSERPNPAAQGRKARIWALQTVPFAIADHLPRKVQRPTVRADHLDDASVLDKAQLPASQTLASSAGSNDRVTA